jgi:adenylate cyclase
MMPLGTFRGLLPLCVHAAQDQNTGHMGRVVNTAGDALLAEFASVVDAVSCGVEIQKELKNRNQEVPESKRMEFRIGINLGDVIEEGEQIYGDGVNIAARLESLADGGGICLSGTVHEHVKNKLSLGYEFIGEQTVKNIKEPVWVYRVLMEPGVTEAGKGLRGKVKGKRALVLGILAAFVVVAAVVALWQFHLRPASQPKMEVASKEKMALTLPDLPSIAVLPFVNMSEDPKQEFLSDGITEEIITHLSKVPGMFVIARNSTFTYKGKSVKVKQISEELGVRYVLEGSLQRSGDRVRITAQLIDALTGNHLWAESYDRELKDIFALQDEITMKVLTATQVKLTGGDVSSAEKYAEKYYRRKQGLECYLKLMKAWGYWDRYNIEDVNLGRRMVEEAIAKCPENPMGYVHLGWCYQHDYWLGNTKSPRETLEKFTELAQKAISMDDSIASAHSLLCWSYILKREYDKAIAEGERAVALDPNDGSALDAYGTSLRFAGRPKEAIPLYQKATRLNPFGSSWLYLNSGQVLRDTGRFEEAVSEYKKAIQRSPDSILAHISLATCYSMMGREKEARAEALEVLRINPKFSVDEYAKILSYKDQLQNDKIVNALRKAGLK